LGEFETHQSSKLAQGIFISQSFTLGTKSGEKLCDKNKDT
jgi:hypothetical protein